MPGSTSVAGRAPNPAEAGDPSILSKGMDFLLHGTIQVATLALVASLTHLLLPGSPPPSFCWPHPSWLHSYQQLRVNSAHIGLRTLAQLTIKDQVQCPTNLIKNDSVYQKLSIV